MKTSDYLEKRLVDTQDRNNATEFGSQRSCVSSEASKIYIAVAREIGNRTWTERSEGE